MSPIGWRRNCSSERLSYQQLKATQPKEAEVKLRPRESNLLDHRGVEAVKTAVKPHALKEKTGVWNRATSFVGLPVQAAGRAGSQDGTGGGREEEGASEQGGGSR